MRLLIGIPSGDYMHAEFVKSLSALVRKLAADGVDFEVDFEVGSLIYMARDRIAQKAINRNFTHVLWLDSDMVFTDEILEDLQFSGKDFVTGIAVSRRSPFSSCLFKNLDLNDLQRFGGWETLPKDTFEVAGCGFACVLIKTEILRSVMMTYHTCFVPENNYGEDTIFCKRATALGFRIFAEPAVRVGHIGHMTIWPDDCDRLRSKLHNN